MKYVPKIESTIAPKNVVSSVPTETVILTVISVTMAMLLSIKHAVNNPVIAPKDLEDNMMNTNLYVADSQLNKWRIGLFDLLF